MITADLFKQKLKAAAYHAVLTLVVAAFAAYLVFFIWYPGAFSTILGGAELYLWVLLVEVCLGPCMSLVIYNSNKSRRELFRDYSIVITVQIAALVYGVYTMALSRPVYIAFVKDRLEIVTPLEFFSEDLEAAKDTEFNHFSWFGPTLVCTDRPEKQEEREKLMFSSLGGRDLHVLPQYYRHCLEGELFQAGLPVMTLVNTVESSSLASKYELQLANYHSEYYRWLPVSTRFGFSSALIDLRVNKPVKYLSIDPYLNE